VGTEFFDRLVDGRECRAEKSGKIDIIKSNNLDILWDAQASFMTNLDDLGSDDITGGKYSIDSGDVREERIDQVRIVELVELPFACVRHMKGNRILFACSCEPLDTLFA
jgi:hypothetical protein